MGENEIKNDNECRFRVDLLEKFLSMAFVGRSQFFGFFLIFKGFGVVVVGSIMCCVLGDGFRVFVVCRVKKGVGRQQGFLNGFGRFCICNWVFSFVGIGNIYLWMDIFQGSLLIKLGISWKI